MTREIQRKKGNSIQIGPDVRRYKGPLICIAAAGFLVIDMVHWHLLHHLLGAGSYLVVWVVMILLIALSVRRAFRRRRG
jgi:uncharacterized membrane protein